MVFLPRVGHDLSITINPRTSRGLIGGQLPWRQKLLSKLLLLNRVHLVCTRLTQITITLTSLHFMNPCPKYSVTE